MPPTPLTLCADANNPSHAIDVDYQYLAHFTIGIVALRRASGYPVRVAELADALA